MKLSNLLTLLIITIMPSLSNGQVKKPNFAYPQNVSVEARADLKKAISQEDAHAALNALIREYLSQSIINPNKTQETIQLTEQTWKKFIDSPLQALFPALLGQMYMNAYISNSWTYNRRDVPMTPLPEDIEEWSGEQFKEKIKSLIEESYIDPQALQNLKIQNYSDLITIDQSSIPYFPTVLDFVYANAYSVLNNINEEVDFWDIPLSDKNINEGPAIYWETEKYLHLNNKEQAERLKSLYQDKKNNELSGYILWMICEQVNLYDLSDDQELAIWCVEEIDLYKSRFSNSEFVDGLKQYEKYLKQIQLITSVPNYCQPGIPFKITVLNRSAEKAEVNVYKLSSIPKGQTYKGNLTDEKKVKTFEIEGKEASPFYEEAQLDITLEEPGAYIIVPNIPEIASGKRQYMITKCVSAYPIAFEQCDKSYIAVVQPTDGAPMGNITIMLSKDYKSDFINIGTTDDKGLIEVTDRLKRNDWRNATIGLNIEGIIYPFEVNVSRQITSRASTNKFATIMTDRSLYHPGDSIKGISIMYEIKNNEDMSKDVKVVENMDICIKLYDVNNQMVDSITGKSDSMGRLAFNLATPKDGLTGTYNIRVFYGAKQKHSGSNRITVSDYRMPEFEIKDFTATRLSATSDTVRIEGKLLSYSGFPIIDASVSVTINRASWFRWFMPGESVYSESITTNTQGEFCLDISLNDINREGQPYFYYIANVEATSQSGSTVQESLPFCIGMPYRIDLSGLSSKVNGSEMYHPDVKVFNIEGQEIEIPLKWQLIQNNDTVKEGNLEGAIDLSNIIPGIYTLRVSPLDEELAESETSTLTIYNLNTEIVPGDKPVWVLQENIQLNECDDNTLNILIGCKEDNTYFYYSLSENNKLLDLHLEHKGKGYHQLAIPYSKSFEQGMIHLVGVRDGKPFEYLVAVKGVDKSKLKIEGSSWRDNLIPGQNETWNLRVVDYQNRPVEAAIILDMYNKALDAIVPHSLSWGVLNNERYSSRSTLNINVPYICSYSNSIESKSIGIPESIISLPSFNFYGQNFSGFIKGGMYFSRNSMLRVGEMDGARNYDLKMALSTGSMDMAYEAEESVAEAMTVEESMTEGEGNSQPSEDFNYRDADVAIGTWAPMLNTDSEGNLVYTFTVPNANTTWRLNAVAWTKNMEIGSLIREFIANKPIMAEPQIPRYLRAGDRAIVKAVIMNNSDSTITAESIIEFFDPISEAIISSKTFNNVIGGKKSVVIEDWVEAKGSETALGYRVKTSNGEFSDGEQGAIVVLPAQSSLIETKPFYLNPGEKIYETLLPSIKDATLSLTFSENPIWAIVSALPGLRKDAGTTANSAAAAIFAAATSDGLIKANPTIAQALKDWMSNPTDSMLISSLEKNEDLKAAMLNCTPWVQAAQNDTERMSNLALIFNKKEIDKSISTGIGQLKKLQKGDGGWSWGAWCTESSLWVTGNVLSMMAELKELGWLPKDKELNTLIAQALKYWDNNVKDKESDLLYTIVRPVFNEYAISLNGQKCISTTINDILKNWKGYDNPSYKALAAEALYRNQYPSKAKELMSSVTQFGTWSKSQGLQFKSVNTLCDYANLLMAYSTITNDTKEIDGLRQQLIVRKQGSDWGSSVVTLEVIRAILSSGSTWTMPAQGAKITCGDIEIKPTNNVEKYSGSIRANLSPYAGEELKIVTEGATPSYGAVYVQYAQEMAEVKSMSCDDLSIEKKYAVKRGTEWEYATDSLEIGDRVKVVLTIHCQRNLSYVTIVDELAAALQPVDQVPGWLYSEGIGFYRECRDSFTGLYATSLRPGTYQLTYEMTVNNAGSFSSGVAIIQSQYAPELSAHSAGQRIIVENTK